MTCIIKYPFRTPPPLLPLPSNSPPPATPSSQYPTSSSTAPPPPTPTPTPSAAANSAPPASTDPSISPSWTAAPAARPPTSTSVPPRSGSWRIRPWGGRGSSGLGWVRRREGEDESLMAGKGVVGWHIIIIEIAREMPRVRRRRGMTYTPDQRDEIPSPRSRPIRKPWMGLERINLIFSQNPPPKKKTFPLLLFATPARKRRQHTVFTFVQPYRLMTPGASLIHTSI